jgi:hypothetical protein
MVPKKKEKLNGNGEILGWFRRIQLKKDVL